MRKIFFTLTLIPFLFLPSLAQAEYEGVTIGLSHGIFGATADGTETVDGTSAKYQEQGAFKDDASSIFVEVDFGRFAIGVDYLAAGIVSPQNTNTVNGSANTQKVEIDELTTVYATLDVIAGLYLKAGYVDGNLDTQEVMATSSQSGSNVGNKGLSGTTAGIGYKHVLDNGFQIRAEVNVSEYDGFSFTDSSGDKYEFRDLYSGRALISLAKTF